jgi:hypothetical protein
MNKKFSGKTRSSLLKKEPPRTTSLELQTLPSLMESSTLKTMPGRRKLRPLMDGQREKMMLAKLRSPTSRTLLKLKMMLAKLLLLTSITLPSLKMTDARLTLLLLVPEQTLKQQPEMEKTRLSVRESARRSLTARLPLLNNRQEGTHRMKRGLETSMLSRLR